MPDNNDQFFKSMDQLINTLKALQSGEIKLVDKARIAEANKKINRMMDVARKRWDAINNDMNQMSTAWSRFGKKGRFTLKNKKGAERYQEIMRAAKFLDDETSKVKGIKREIEKFRPKNNAKNIVDMAEAARNTYKNLNRVIGEAYDALHQIQSVAANYYNAEQINREHIFELAQKLNADLTSPDADIGEIVDLIVNEAEQLGSNRGVESASSALGPFVGQGLGGRFGIIKK